MKSFIKFFNIIGLVAVILLGFFYLKPLFDENVSVKEKLERREVDRDAIVTELENFTSISGDEINEADIQEFLTKVPKELEQDILLENLFDISERVNVSLNSVSFGVNQSELASVKTIQISAAFLGQYSDLVDLLREIEDNPRKINVRSISIQFGEGEGSSQQISFNLNMESYYSS